MGTLNPDDELSKWKTSIVPAVEISCKSHYGSDELMPVFPWFLETSNPQVSEELGRLAQATKRRVKAFSREVANFLERTIHEIAEKKQSLLVNRVDVVSIDQRLHSLSNPKPGPSFVSVKCQGSQKTLMVVSRTTAIGPNPKAELSLDVLSVKHEGDDIYVEKPKDILCELTLEKLSLPSIEFERSTRAGGEPVTLEITIRLSESDQMEVLTSKIGLLDDIKSKIEADVRELEVLKDGVMEALDIKDDPKLNQPKERDCEYCAIL